MIDLLISYEKSEREESSRKEVLKPISNIVESEKRRKWMTGNLKS